MKPFYFSDGEDICRFDGKNVVKYSSDFAQTYKRNMQSIQRSKEWKMSGDGAKFRNDINMPYNTSEEQQILKLSGIYARNNQFLTNSFDSVFDSFNSNSDSSVRSDAQSKGVSSETIYYSFVIGNTSGIYSKDLKVEKNSEGHIINSVDYKFLNGCFDSCSNTLAIPMQDSFYTANIALFNVETGDYTVMTDGDSFDIDPYICPNESHLIYYSSRSVGRSGNGEFVCFSPSSIYLLDTNKVDVSEIISSEKYNFYKPVLSGGKLYTLRTPVNDKKYNPFIEILLIPVRLIQAIALFLNLFITAFTGKSITNGGDNPAKGRDYDNRKIVIKGNLVDADKEYKKNLSKRSVDVGFAPKGWEIYCVTDDKVIQSGVIDYDIDVDGTIVYTNGRHIFAIENSVKRKICSAECCLTVNCVH